MIFKVVKDEIWNYIWNVKMKYEILKLVGLITNFISEENTETERKSRRDVFIIILADSKK